MAKTIGMQLVTNFNVITGLKLRTGEEKRENTPNADKMEYLIQLGIPFDRVCNYMEDWYEDNKNNINSDTAMIKFYNEALNKAKANVMPRSTAWSNGVRNVSEIKSEQTHLNESKPVTQDVTGLITGITNVVNMAIKDTADDIKNAVKTETIDELKQYVHDNFEVTPRKHIIIINNEVKKEVKGIVHHAFDEVLYDTMHGLNVYLVGPAGSGKNKLVEQIAEAMDLPFRMTNAITYEHQLMGFVDGNGKYHGTPFYELWVNGGVFLLDEIDASSQEVTIKLDAAIANGYADFPIGNIKKHENFHIIAAGNTYGLGADYEYVGRNVLDAAFLNRFVTVEVDYDPNIENLMANGDNNLLDFCRNFRDVCRQLGVKTIVSLRNINAMQIKSHNPKLTKAQIINSCLTASMKYDDLNMINHKITAGGEWRLGLSQLVDMKKEAVA